MAGDNDSTDGNDSADVDVRVCTRILNDTIAHLARRYGVAAVVMSLTDIVGCPSCVSGTSRGGGIPAVVRKLGGGSAR